MNEQLNILASFLDKANQNGVYNLNESVTIYSALQQLAQTLNAKIEVDELSKKGEEAERSKDSQKAKKAPKSRGRSLGKRTQR